MDDEETLAGRVRAAILDDDPALFAALFDLPAIVFAAGRTDVRRTRADLVRAHGRLRHLIREYGAVDYRSEPVAVRPLGERLLVVRRNTRLVFADGATTDPNEELWAARQGEDGLFRMALAVNSMAGWLRPTEALEAARPAEAEGALDVASFAARMERSVEARDADGNFVLVAAPFARLADAATEVFVSPAELREACDRFFDHLDAYGLLSVKMVPQTRRPYGGGFEIARVEVAAGWADGSASDPYTEVWVLRETRGALRLHCIVNPLEGRLLSAPLPDRRPT